jgi:hypothetical protein
MGPAGKTLRRAAASCRALYPARLAGCAATVLLLAFPSRAAEARLEPVTASSVHSPSYPCDAAFDGDRRTRWASRDGGKQWLQVDLGTTVRFERVTIAWERAMAVDYDVQTSDDGQTWHTVAEQRDPEGQRQDLAPDTLVDEFAGLAASGRYLRVLCLRPSRYTLYSIWEVEFPEPEVARQLKELVEQARSARQEERRREGSTARNALLEKGIREVVFAVRQEWHDGHWYANFGYYAPAGEPRCYAAGGRLAVLAVDSGSLRLLVDDPDGSIRDPWVRYDGQRVLFSWRRAGSGTFHLYDIGADGSGLRQITEGPYDDIEPIGLPDGDILFVSARCRRWVNCWLTQVATLHRCDPEGRHIRQLSANLEHDNTPWLLPDGRVLYQRWEYVDRSQVHYHHLWTANPDGSGQMVFFGNQHPGGVFIDAKPIPGSGEVVLIHSPGHGLSEHRGMIAVVSPKGGPDQGGALRDLSGPDYTDPYPLSPDLFLAARYRELVLFRRDGRDVLLAELPAEWGPVTLHEPRPLLARPREPVIPSRTDERAETGTLVLSDLYRGRSMAGVHRGEVAELLVLESLPKPVNFTGGMEPLSYGGTFTLERIVGTVPVAADGSAHFELPANRAFFFVALDRHGRSVKRMQSFTSVMPGERTGCVGCHESRLEAPANVSGRSGTALAAAGPPAKPIPVPGVPAVMDFPRDVQPVLDRHCVRCHNPGKRSGGILLTGDRGPVYSHSYFTLSARRLVADGRNLPQSNYPPRAIGDSASPLLAKTDGTHHDVSLPETDQRLLRCWINSGAAWPGTYAALGTGMIGGYAQNVLDRSDLQWPAVKAAAAVIERRCLSCHTLPERPLPRSPSDDLDMPPWAIDYASPRLRFSRHVLYNLSRPEASVQLLAPLATAVGGYGLCRAADLGAGQGAVFASTEDPDYRVLLAAIQEAADHLQRIKRFDMPDFRPRSEYVREMVRYGVLPAESATDDAAVDPYQADARYWELVTTPR